MAGTRGQIPRFPQQARGTPTRLYLGRYGRVRDTCWEGRGLSGCRIILVLNEPPLPFGGAAARWYYVLLKGLVERGHRVTAFATYAHPVEADDARQLFPSGTYDLRLYPHPIRRGWSAKIQ